MEKHKKRNGRTAESEHYLWKGRLRRERSLKSGETLVEVMVSIVIFLLLVALLQGSVAFCTNAQRKSREIRENTATAIEAYWIAKDDGSVASENDKNSKTETLGFQAESGGTVFSVKVTLDEYSVSTGDDSGTGETVTFYTFGNSANSSSGSSE